MSTWDIINTEWDPDQETVNFGTRQFVVVDSAIYDVVTLATIESQGLGCKSEPRVCGNLWEQITVLAVENYIHILKDSCQTVLKSFSLDSCPACLGWSSDGKFLFIVTETGFMTVIYIPQNLLVNSRQIPSFDSRNQPVDIHVGSDEILVLGSNGLLFRMKNVCLTALSSALDERNLSKAKEVQIQMTDEFIQCGLDTVIATACVVEDQDEQPIYVVGNTHGLFLWDFRRNIIITGTPIECALKEIQSTKCKQFIVALDMQGNVTCYDRHFLLPVYDLQSIEQLILYQLDLSTNRTLTLDKDDTQNQSIVMRSFMGVSAEYRVQVTDFCYLLTSYGCQNDIVFVEGARDANGNITTLRIRSMTEGRPIDRLKRLIARSKFEEGLNFARNFNLDAQLVYTAKATHLTQQLSVWANTEEELLDGKYDEWQATLGCITDMRFIVECCLKFAPSRVQFIRNSLSYARKRLDLYKPPDQDEESEKLQYIMEVCGVQEKLETFELIYGTELIDYWYTIDMKDMFNTLIEILNAEEMTRGLILWQRHNVEIVTAPSFDEEETKQLLGSIPAGMKSDALLPWLQLVLPSLVQFDPDRISLVVEWIVQKAASFESDERDKWPRNALTFTSALSDSLKCVVGRSTEEATSPLLESIEIFKEMVVLYEQYKIPITFGKYAQDNRLATVGMLLNWLSAATDVGPFMDAFLLPFMRRRSMDIDESVFHYILNLLHNSVSWWHSGQAQWEQIVSTLIIYIKSIEVQAKSILAALFQAPVPWSETITNLAEKGEKLEHSLAFQIKEEHHIVPLKTVLRHYNIHVYDLGDLLLMDCIIRNILKQETDECLEHALTVARTSNAIPENDVRNTFVTSLLVAGKHELLVETLSKMSAEDRASCCHKLVYFIEGALNRHVNRASAVNSKRADTCMRSLSAVWDCLVAACPGDASSGKMASMRRRVGDVHRVHQLTTYRVLLTSNDYCHPARRSDALRRFCSDTLQQDAVDYTRLNRVAHLLSVSEAMALQQMALAARNVESKTEVMVACAQRLLLCTNDAETAEACYVVAQCLNASGRANDTIELQNRLASKSATYSSSDCLLDSSELCRLVNLRHLIHKRSSDSQKGSSPDVYNSFSSLGVYQDFTTPILNREIMKKLSTAQARILPFIHPGKGSNSIVGLSWRMGLAETAEALRDFANDCLAVVQVLRGCRQMMPALYVAYAADSLVQLLFPGLVSNCQLVSSYNRTVAKHFDELSSQLLVRIMTANRPDVPDMALATSCLLILGPKEGYKSLVELVKRSTSDRRRVFYVGFLGRLLFKLSATGGEEEGFFESVLIRCHWSLKLAPYGVHIQLPPFDEMLPIMETLVTIEDVPLDVLSSFCATFPLNVNAAYVARAHFLITTTDATNLKRRLPKILQVLQRLSPIDVQKTVASVKNKVSPYNYDLLKCLLSTLISLQPEAPEIQTMLDLLEFLSCYSRCTPPGIMEQQSFFFRLPGSEEWPLKRLPMFYQIDTSMARSIYHEEFNVTNWTVWYDSPALLPINRDEICMLAVSNTVKRYNKDNQDESQIEGLFEKIKVCLESISTVPLAAACAADLTQRMATSPEHFYAADLHMRQCEKWKNNDDDPAGIAAYNKSVKVFQKVQTEESLSYYELRNKRTEALTQYPERLVRLLFEEVTSADRFVAINKAAENIAQIYDLNLRFLKHAFIQEWLPPIESYQQEDFYHVDANASNTDSNTNSQNEVNLQRVICLLSGSDYAVWIAFLREKALNEDERPAVRVRALTALQASLSPDQMVSHLEMHSYALDLRIKVLTFLSRLEFLGLVYREEEFEVTDKADLIRALLQSGGDTQRCITLAMDLATANVTQDADIWKSILQSVVKFNMIETARNLIKDISEIRLLWINPVMAPVWNLILQSPFKHCNGDSEECLLTLQMLWKCPILEDIDLDTLEQCILSHDYPYFVALLLPFVRQEKRSNLIEKLHDISNTCDLKKYLHEKCQTYPYLNQITKLLTIG